MGKGRTFWVVRAALFIAAMNMISHAAYGQDSSQASGLDNNSGQQGTITDNLKTNKDKSVSGIVPGMEEHAEGPWPDLKDMWYNKWNIAEDRKLHERKNTLRLAPQTREEIERGRTELGPFNDYLRKRRVSERLLIWQYVGTRDIEGQQLRLWLTVIEEPQSRYNMISISNIKLAGTSRILFIGAIGAESYWSPTIVINKSQAKEKRIRHKCDGDTIYIYYYSDDPSYNPNYNAPFTIDYILSLPADDTGMKFGPNNTYGVADCSLGPCSQSWGEEAKCTVLILA